MLGPHPESQDPEDIEQGFQIRRQAEENESHMEDNEDTPRLERPKRRRTLSSNPQPISREQSDLEQEQREDAGDEDTRTFRRAQRRELQSLLGDASKINPNLLEEMNEVSPKRVTRGKTLDFSIYYQDEPARRRTTHGLDGGGSSRRRLSDRQLSRSSRHSFGKVSAPEPSRVLPQRSTRYHGHLIEDDFGYDEFDDEDMFVISKKQAKPKPVPIEKLERVDTGFRLTRNKARMIVNDMPDEDEEDQEESEEEQPKRPSSSASYTRPIRLRLRSPADDQSQEPSEETNRVDDDVDDEPIVDESGYPLRSRNRRLKRLVSYQNLQDYNEDGEGNKQYSLRPRNEPKNYEVRIPLYAAEPTKQQQRRHAQSNRFAGIRKLGRGDGLGRSLLNKKFNQVLLGPGIDSSDEDEDIEKKSQDRLASIRSTVKPLNSEVLNANDIDKLFLRGTKSFGTKALADNDPLKVDKEVGFDCVGGLDEHVKSLKEMVLLPLLYPEVFNKFGITPPRGVLFHGPPGTGKTLLARALANACSSESQKVAFFMRKGADVLCKWVGESERQLKLLFDQARAMQPSIIFFDEIDGLAPVRSSKQDQIHASIVTTLLALMDGLDSRGQVIVIGATNRIDAIDPALRRPGRFDREFMFTLPNKEARERILNIHTRKWNPPLDVVLVSKLAQATTGYSGSDLRALCSEATLKAVERVYPQLYTSEKKLLIDVSKIIVTQEDFAKVMTKVVSTNKRSTGHSTSPLRPPISHLLGEQFDLLFAKALAQFPIDNPSSLAFKTLEDAVSGYSSLVNHPRLLVSSYSGNGQDELVTALLDHYDNFPKHYLDVNALYSDISPENALVSFFKESFRTQPAIIVIKNIDLLWSTFSDTIRSLVKNILVKSERNRGVFIVATSTVQGDMEHVFDEWKLIFQPSDTFLVEYASLEQRLAYFTAFYSQCIMAFGHVEFDLEQEVFTLKKDTLTECEIKLEEVPPPAPRQLTMKEIKMLHEYDQSVFRKLRLVLREFIVELIRCKEYKSMTKGLNPVEDYGDTVKWDAQDILENLEMGSYTTVKEFRRDINMMLDNFRELAGERGELERVTFVNAIGDIFGEWLMNFDAELAGQALESSLREKRLHDEYELLRKSSADDKDEEMVAVAEEMSRESRRLKGEEPEHSPLTEKTSEASFARDEPSGMRDESGESVEEISNAKVNEESQSEKGAQAMQVDESPMAIAASPVDEVSVEPSNSPDAVVDQPQKKVYVLPTIRAFSRSEYGLLADKLNLKLGSERTIRELQGILSAMSRALMNFRKNIIERMESDIEQEVEFDLLRDLSRAVN